MSNELIRIRRQKVDEWRALGVEPWAYHYSVTHRAADILADAEAMVNATVPVGVAVAGRLVAKRGHGKTCFGHLLDATGKTEKLYGIRAHPTGLLIDPDGKLVGEARADELEAKLPPLSVAKKWARHRDLYKNVYWSFEPSAYTLPKLADMLKRWTNSAVELDADAVKACGLTPDGPLPGVLIGVNVTLRSIEELLLAPHGLGVVPSADGKKLLITKRTGTKEAESYLQKLHAHITELDPGAGYPSHADDHDVAIIVEAVVPTTWAEASSFDVPTVVGELESDPFRDQGAHRVACGGVEIGRLLSAPRRAVDPARGLRDPRAGRAQFGFELLPEGQVQIDAPVGRAIERPHGRLAHAAAGAGGLVVEHDGGRRPICLAGFLKLLGPDGVNAAADDIHEASRLVGRGSAHALLHLPCAPCAIDHAQGGGWVDPEDEVADQGQHHAAGAQAAHGPRTHAAPVLDVPGTLSADPTHAPALPERSFRP